jgi:hypothetical protein
MGVDDKVGGQERSDPPHGRARETANLVHERVSTDQQSTARQNSFLDQSGIEDPVVFEEEAAAQRKARREYVNRANALTDDVRS